jgi:hypothetical protein
VAPSEIKPATFWLVARCLNQLRNRDNTICNGINLRDKKVQTTLEDMTIQFGCAVIVVEENALNLLTGAKKTIQKIH